MHCPKWLVTPCHIKIDNKGYVSDLKDEHFEMHVNLEAMALFKSNNFSEYWSNINTATKYPKLRGTAILFLLAFTTSYVVEVGF